MDWRRRAMGVAVSMVACACGPKVTSPVESARVAEGDGNFQQREDEILRDLAAIDRRVAQRARLTPSEDDLRRVAMAAVLREDATVALIDGAIDPFSFDARARGLDAARKKIEVLRPPPRGAHANERELLARLVEAEGARLDEERTLPRSASSLVRAIVDTWHAPKDEREAAEGDRWLSGRLSTLRESLIAPREGSALDVVRARELDDALDALERLAATPGFTSATQELVRVREALEAAGSKPAAKAQSDWSLVARRARAHLGVTASAELLARDLTALQGNLRTQAEQAAAAANVGREALTASLSAHVLVAGPCVDAVPGSRVRSMAAPQEREPACHLRHFLANTDLADGAARAAALAIMHDHVVVASWALDVARGESTIAEAESKHRLFAPVSPDTRARYERVALARPIAAIGAGEAARLLAAGDVTARARAWSTLGDVPLDVARRELDATRDAEAPKLP